MTEAVRGRLLSVAAVLAVTAAACGVGVAAQRSGKAAVTKAATASSTTSTSTTSTSTTSSTSTTTTQPPGPQPLPVPAALAPFGAGPAGQGLWTAAGRPVNGNAAVYETNLVPPGGASPAGLAWLDTRLLSAQLYSGSKSPGGGPYQFTAPIQPPQAATLVAAFNGGFQMKDARGGYYTEGRSVYPLIAGAASLVIYADGTATVGAWGTDVAMTPDVIAVRQNLVPLVAAGRPTPQATSPDWQSWGATCSATSCGHGLPGVENQWRSGLGVTADGALVYAAGPGLAPVQLAQLLVRAGVVRGMELDINPSWPVFATYAPSPPDAPASPGNGTSLRPSSLQGPATFFNPAWGRDFVAMSARRAG